MKEISSPTALEKQGHQDLHGGDYKLSNKSVPVLCHPYSKEALPGVQREPPVLHFVPIASCPATRSIFSAPSLNW